jgi:hypothetical protein
VIAHWQSKARRYATKSTPSWLRVAVASPIAAIVATWRRAVGRSTVTTTASAAQDVRKNDGLSVITTDT